LWFLLLLSLLLLQLSDFGGGFGATGCAGCVQRHTEESKQLREKLRGGSCENRKKKQSPELVGVQSIPRTCLSSILGLEPSKRRPFPIKIRVIWVPGR